MQQDATTTIRKPPRPPEESPNLIKTDQPAEHERRILQNRSAPTTRLARPDRIRQYLTPADDTAGLGKGTGMQRMNIAELDTFEPQILRPLNRFCRSVRLPPRAADMVVGTRCALAGNARTDNSRVA